MALTENTNDMVMPVQPMYGNGGMNNGFGGDWAWIILLLLLGWGNNGFGGGYGGNSQLYPWMNQAEITTNGFANQANGMAISALQGAVTTGFGDVQNALCGGFAGVNANISNGFAQAEISNNARQIADMQQMFSIQSALQNCCCENRAGLADVKYTVATEACADRNALAESTQKILDQMCQDKIDAKNEKIAELQSQLQMAQLAASQRVQTQAILTDNLAQTNALEQYLAPVPRPAYIVQNPNCCTNGCGCGNF